MAKSGKLKHQHYTVLGQFHGTYEFETCYACLVNAPKKIHKKSTTPIFGKEDWKVEWEKNLQVYVYFMAWLDSRSITLTDSKNIFQKILGLILGMNPIPEKT